MLDWVCEVMQARSARRLGRIQQLWGGYGELVRVALDGSFAQTILHGDAKEENFLASGHRSRR